MKVVVLVRGRDVPQEQRSHLWRLKQEEIKNNNLIMAVIEFLLCSSSRSRVTSALRSVGRVVVFRLYSDDVQLCALTIFKSAPQLSVMRCRSSRGVTQQRQRVTRRR